MNTINGLPLPLVPVGRESLLGIRLGMSYAQVLPALQALVAFGFEAPPVVSDDTGFLTLHMRDAAGVLNGAIRLELGGDAEADKEVVRAGLTVIGEPFSDSQSAGQRLDEMKAWTQAAAGAPTLALDMGDEWTRSGAHFDTDVAAYSAIWAHGSTMKGVHTPQMFSSLVKDAAGPVVIGHISAVEEGGVFRVATTLALRD